MNRKILIIVVLSIGLVAAGGYFAYRAIAPAAARTISNSLSSYLAVRVEVGSVKVSLLRDFPHASLLLGDVRMKEAVPGKHPDNLLEAGAIALRFNLLDLFRGKYQIHTIRVQKGTLHFKVFADGSDNYHFWKKSTNQGGKVQVSLKNILLQGVTVQYSNLKNHSLARMGFPDMEAAGDFSNEQFDLTIEGISSLDTLVLNEVKYPGFPELKLDIALNANTNKGDYKITRGKVKAGKLNLQTDGTLRTREQGNEVDLSLQASNTTLGELASLIPGKYKTSVKDFRYDGQANLSMKIRGVLADGRTPDMDIRLNVADGSVSPRNGKTGLRKLNGQFAFSLTRNGSSREISVSDFSAHAGAGFIQGSATLPPGNPQSLQCKLAADLDLNELNGLLGTKLITSMQGKLKLDAIFSGSFADIAHPSAAEFLSADFEGQAQIRDASVSTTAYAMPIQGINASVRFNGAVVETPDLNARAGANDVNFRGEIHNLLPWMFLEGQSLDFSGQVRAKRNHVDELSDAIPSEGQKPVYLIPDDIVLHDLQYSVADFTFDDFKAQNLSAGISLRNRVLVAKSIQANSCGGRITGTFTLDGRNPNSLITQTHFNAAGVDMKRMFAEFGNFGQTELVDDNLSGTLTADVIFSGWMDRDYNFDLGSIKAHADMELANGRLTHYAPMQSLSGFLRVEDLADIRFSTLKNQIDIANRIIHIPNMHVQSSALEFDMMGSHTFDNELDYHFVIGLSDLLRAKYLRHNPRPDNQDEFGKLEEDGRGKTKIYVSLTGTIDQPEVKYDKQAARNKLSNDLKSQKQELKEILRQEFGRFGNDTARSKARTREEEIKQQQENGKFVIEWDDDNK